MLNVYFLNSSVFWYASCGDGGKTVMEITEKPPEPPPGSSFNLSKLNATSRGFS